MDRRQSNLSLDILRYLKWDLGSLSQIPEISCSTLVAVFCENRTNPICSLPFFSFSSTSSSKLAITKTQSSSLLKLESDDTWNFSMNSCWYFVLCMCNFNCAQKDAEKTLGGRDAMQVIAYCEQQRRYAKGRCKDAQKTWHDARPIVIL